MPRTLAEIQNSLNTVVETSKKMINILKERERIMNVPDPLISAVSLIINLSEVVEELVFVMREKTQ